VGAALAGKTIRRSARVAWRVFNDQAVVLDTEANRIYGLNGTGAQLWELICDELPFAELVNRFAHENSKTAGDVEADVVEFIETMQGKGLVEVI